MSTIFYIKRNDTSPSISRNLTDAAGNIIDLTGATVRFHMNELDGTNIVDAAATITNAAGGVVQYDWQAADTANSGLFNAEWEITFSDGSIETVPNSLPHETISISDDLA